MRYGYFDEKNKEYVISRPDTPAPWVNYLGSPEYGAIISNNAGGYSFYKSGASGRIIRYRFNHKDEPGRYIYLRDSENGDYWSASWQPVGKTLDKYSHTCRHGTAYTLMNAEYSGISAETLFYVPLGKTYEVWRVRLKNCSDTDRRLSVTGFVEFTTDNHYEQDSVNLQYTQYITRTRFKNGNKIEVAINENCHRPSPEETNGAERFFGVAGAAVSSYCGDRDSFLGNYRSYANPAAIEKGDLGNVLNYNCNPCGALMSELSLKAGESAELVYLLGQRRDAESAAIISSYSEPLKTVQELDELKSYWHGFLSNLRVNTPDDNFNAMINTWNAYQCFITFTWSRAASFSYCGQRNGFGYRDTVQDIQGVIHLAPELAKKQLSFMLSAQVDNGGGLPLVKYSHNAGHEDTPDDDSYVKETGHPHYRADDALWLFPTVYKLVAETGDTAFLDEIIPYANKGEDTVYNHLRRAIEFSMERLGAHGLPAGLHADWNDCLRMGAKGESSFVAMQLYWAFGIMLAFNKHDCDYGKYLTETRAALGAAIQKHCWDGDRFIRGIREDGVPVGAKADPEASMWLNPQSWAVISGLSDTAQTETVLDSVYRLLNTRYGARLLTPPYKNHAFDGALMLLFNPSTKENGAIFSQSQGWLILAEALAGHGDRAFEYFSEICPASMNDEAEKRVLEPYVHGQFVESVESPHEGRAHVHWLTGTASTVMVGCVEGILGLRPDLNGLWILPCVPSDWTKFEIDKVFRGCKLHITVEKTTEVSAAYLNGEKLAKPYIPASALKAENEIKIILP